MDALHQDYSVGMAEAGPIAGRVVGPGTNTAAVALCLPKPEEVETRTFGPELTRHLVSISLPKEAVDNLIGTLKESLTAKGYCFA